MINHNWIGSFDPTDNNCAIYNKQCPECGGREFETHKEGDFRSILYVDICKDCRMVYQNSEDKLKIVK